MKKGIILLLLIVLLLGASCTDQPSGAISTDINFLGIKHNAIGVKVYWQIYRDGEPAPSTLESIKFGQMWYTYPEDGENFTVRFFVVSGDLVTIDGDELVTTEQVQSVIEKHITIEHQHTYATLTNGQNGIECIITIEH